MHAQITVDGQNVTKIEVSGFANAHTSTPSGLDSTSGPAAFTAEHVRVDVQANQTVPFHVDFQLHVSAPLQRSCTQGQFLFGDVGTVVSEGAGCGRNFPDSDVGSEDGTLVPGPDAFDARLTTGSVHKVSAGAGQRSATTSYSITVTLQAPCTIVGTEGDDDGFDNPSLKGTGGADVICGLGGEDVIEGLDGDDTIEGGEGCLRALGGQGDDVIIGGIGPGDTSCHAVFTLEGRPDDDVITLNADQVGGLYGEGGADTITGGPNVDVIAGGGGGDVIVGGPGNDTIDGDNFPDDTSTGPPGIDTISGDAGKDDIDGGGARDDIDGGPDPDELDGGPGNFDDHIVGGDTHGAAFARLGADDIIDGGPGADHIEGALGGDQVEGGGGDDIIEGEGGRDQLQGGPGDDGITGGALADVYLGGGDNDTFFARDDVRDTLNGGPGAEDEAFVDRSDILHSIETIHLPPTARALR